MFLNGYPYTDFHELNLDFLLRSMEELKKAFASFTASNSLIFAEPMLHDLTSTYAKNTIVLDSDGNAYISLQNVPAGVQLSNAYYWLMVFNFEEYTEKANKNFTVNYLRDTTRAPQAYAIGDWIILDDVLYKVTVAIAADDLLEVGVNLVHFTVEQFLKDFVTAINQTVLQYKNDIDASEYAYRQQLAQDIADTTATLQAQLDAAISGATVDSEVINARVGWDNTAYNTLRDAIVGQIGQCEKCLGLITSANYSSDLPDADNVSDNGFYTMMFNWGSSSITANLPYTTSKGTTDLFLNYKVVAPDTSVYRRQIYVYNNETDGVIDIYTRRAANNVWKPWVLIASSDIDGLKTVVDALADQLNELDSFVKSSAYVRTTTPARNLINYDLVILGRMVDTTGVEASGGASFDVTPFIPISAGVTLKSVQCGLTCFYDSSKNFISYVSVPDGNTTPVGCAYMRIDIPASQFTAQTAVCYDLPFLPTNNDLGLITLSKNKQIETHLYTMFTVPVNQAIVNLNDTADALEDSEASIVNVDCYLRLPANYEPYGKPTKLLMLCHGAGRGITVANEDDGLTWLDIADYNNLVVKFVAAGYAVFDCNGYDNTPAGCSFWGCHRGLEAWRKAYDYIVKNYNVEENLSIYAFSMGGLTAMNLLLNGFPNVKCVALGSPVLDLEKVWDAGNQSVMRSAYGMSTNYDPDLACGCDPITRLIEIDNTEYCLDKLPPIKIWYGSTETGVAVNKAYASQYVDAIRNGGNWAIYREVTGAGHEICYGGNANMNTEYLYWINRFNN